MTSSLISGFLFVAGLAGFLARILRKSGEGCQDQKRNTPLVSKAVQKMLKRQYP
jgi:hypothetical protein